jgi:hypothetical protein
MKNKIKTLIGIFSCLCWGFIGIIMYEKNYVSIISLYLSFVLIITCIICGCIVFFIKKKSSNYNYNDDKPVISIINIWIIKDDNKMPNPLQMAHMADEVYNEQFKKKKHK